MKILHLVQHFHPCTGGVETYVLGLCRQLIKAGHTSDVACLDTCSNSKEKLPPYEKLGSIRIHRVPYLDLKYYKPSPLFLKFMKPYDVIHVHGLGFLSDFASLTRLFHRKPIVLHTHGGIFHTRSLSVAKKIYFNLWSKLVLKGVKIIAISRNDQEIFSRVSDSVTLVPNAIDTEAYRNLKRKPIKNSFLYVGRLAANKRLDNLLKTMAFLKKNIPGLKLTIAGEDWQGIRKDLESLAQNLGILKNVSFVGKVSDKERLSLLSSNEFFVSSSEYEGFGITAIEAMAAGMPVILNDIKPFRDIAGTSGFLVDFNEPESAASSILKILKKPLVSVSKESREAVQFYGWERIIKRIENVYRESRS